MGGSNPSPPPAQTSTTVTNQPPSYVRPYIEKGLEESFNLLDKPLEYYPGSTVVPFSPETETALGMQTARAMHGSPLTAAAQGETAKTLAGDYYGAGNPYTRSLLSDITSAVKPQVDAGFSKAGRYGSGMHADTVSRAVTEAAAPSLFGFANSERDRMLKSTATAPLLAANDYTDIANLGQVGAMREAKSAESLGEDIARYEFQQSEPWKRVLPLTQLAYQGASTGGTSNTVATNPYAYGYGASPLDYASAATSGLGSVAQLAPLLLK